jgi:hypothetical protein
MTDREILEKLKKLPTAERLKIVESAVHQLREELEEAVEQGGDRLAKAAQTLLADYVSDPELTAFTVLDSEPFHA